MPDVGDVANYRRLRAALPEGELTERQQRYLRWLAGWDTDTAEAVASLFRFAREATAPAPSSSWAAGADIPDAAPTCPDCGSTLAEVRGRSGSGREIRGVICFRCASTEGTGTAHLDDEDT
jgi:hypothetical protein